MLTAFDVGVGVLVLISAILATARGLTREVLSLATWAGSAAIAVYMYLYHPEIAQQYIAEELVANIATVVVTFIVALIVLHLLTMRIADFVVDSKVGPIDRIGRRNDIRSRHRPARLRRPRDERGRIRSPPGLAKKIDTQPPRRCRPAVGPCRKIIQRHGRSLCRDQIIGDLHRRHRLTRGNQLRGQRGQRRCIGRGDLRRDRRMRRRHHRGRYRRDEQTARRRHRLCATLGVKDLAVVRQ